MSELFPMSNELIDLARKVGTHPARLALWNEGAVAARLPSGNFAVSAAGSHLARLEERHVVELDLAKTQELLAQDQTTDDDLAEALTQGDEAGTGPAPSGSAFAFAGLFAFEGVRFAAHTQPIPVNQVICSPRARQFTDRRNLPHEVVACGQASVLVPFMPPGIQLAREMKRKIALWQDRYKTIPKVILVQNHGMIALGETPEEVLMRTEMTIKFAEIFLGAAMMGGPEFMKPTYVTQIDATKLV